MLRSKLFFVLAISMAGLVAISNFLVQFPVNYFEMDSILTYAAFTYPITFLITDLANRKYGKFIARKIVYLGFFTGVLLTLLFSTNFQDLISIRIAIGSGTAFLFAQLLDVNVFDLDCHGICGGGAQYADSVFYFRTHLSHFSSRIGTTFR